MKRSLHVAAPLLASTALALLAGCRKPEMQRCVDEQNRVVDDHFCQVNGQQPLNGGTNAGHGYGGGYVPMYRYYYGGWGGYTPGSIVSGGGYSAISGHSYSSSTVRGGFGSTHSSGGSGHGGGE